MILTIDNLDGNGAVDYTGSLTTKTKLRIERQLNETTICAFSIAVDASLPIVPLRFGRVVVADGGGVILFTGYVATDPVLEVVGENIAGPAYEATMSAESDDVLLNMQGIPRASESFAESAGQLLENFMKSVDPARFTVDSSPATGIVGRYVLNPAESWSRNLGSMASGSRNAFHVLTGNLTMAPIGNVVHTLSEEGGSLKVNQLQASNVKMLANDVTVCGDEEPAAYVTEIFTGDGITTVFDLTEELFFPSSTRAQPLADLFQTPAINPLLWQTADPGARLSITAGGLTCSGGNGYDGQTTLYASDNLELGGSLVIEASGFTVGNGSQGIVSGLYGGSVNTANCVAGFQIDQISGATTIAPLINSAVGGSSFSPVAGHLYTLRTRIYCKEIQRVAQAYYSAGDSGTRMWGGTTIPAGAQLSLEVQDMTNSVSQTPVVLYDGSLAPAPSICTYALINSRNLFCAVRSITVMQEGPVWITSILPGGTAWTRRVGTTAQGADCRVERTGKLRFYDTSMPQAGEQIFVSYRTKARAVARKTNSVSPAMQSGTSIPSISRWVGTVTSPETMSSADCENAAAALLNLASSRAAAWKGTYTGWNLDTDGDVWPGDVLAVTSANLTADLVIRSVRIEASHSLPTLLRYTVSFANDWADALAIRTTSSVPRDTWLPQQPQSAEPLQNLLSFAVDSVSASAIQVNAGTTAPAGGGFEVRRRDWAFGPGTDSDLVLRSPVSNFSIPREAAMEQYYIRMYDGSTPPNYSRFSSAVVVNVPL